MIMDETDILQICLSIAIIIIGIIVASLFHISLPQPNPTSPLITSNNVKITELRNIQQSGINFIPEYFDSNGRGYYYLMQPFTDKSILVGDTYDIQYYCNENGDRQIYSFIDKIGRAHV